jgi:hypothetical protein
MPVHLVPPESSRLQRFQQQFARALLGRAAPEDCEAGIAGLMAQPGFAVYRNTVHKGCIDALQANYPAVTQLVGEEWMRAAAAEFLRAHLPATPMLLDYGVQFAAFIADFEPAAGFPYLCGVARLDRFWTEAHGARDESVLAPERLATLAAADYTCAVLRPHASARWAWFPKQPIFSIWSRNRHEGAFDETEIDWHGEGALVVRPFDSVQAYLLERADVAFLDACASGQTLTEAALAALEADGAANLAHVMTRLLTAGALGQLDFELRDP